jgi:hypothetical protein
MIIFGSGRKAISGSTRAVPHPCPSCGQMALGQTVFQRYFHLFFIPTFPLGKDCVGHCGHCRRTMPMPVPPTSTPIWSFAGAGVLAVIFGLGVVSSAMQKASTKTAAAAPQLQNAAAVAPATPPPPPKRKTH